MLKSKIAQMLIVGFKGKTVDSSDPIVQAILKQGLGGVILFDYDMATRSFDRNIESPAQLKALTQQLQRYAQEAQHSQALPLLIGVDYEGGQVNRLKEKYGFMKTVSAAELASFSEDKIKAYAAQMADTLAAAGINLNFAPCIDVNINSHNPIIARLGRSFSADPDMVSRDAAFFIEAQRARGIVSVLKHFPGHGSATGDTHEGWVDVTSTWQEAEWKPYRDLLPVFSDSRNDCVMVMCAHVVHEGLDHHHYPASLSTAMVSGLLREQFHFNGVVITDDLQMKAIADHYSLVETLRLTINAGVDMLIFGNQLAMTPVDPIELINIIDEEVKAGRIREVRIEEAYERIKQLKQSLLK